MQKKLKTIKDLQDWLVTQRQVPEDIAIAVAPILHDNEYFYPHSLLDVPRNRLERLNIKGSHVGVLHFALQTSADELPAQQGVGFGPFLLLNHNRTDQGSVWHFGWIQCERFKSYAKRSNQSWI